MTSCAMTLDFIASPMMSFNASVHSLLSLRVSLPPFLLMCHPVLSAFVVFDSFVMSGKSQEISELFELS